MGCRGVVIAVDQWLLVEVMGLGCYGRGIGGCGFGVEKGLMAIGQWLWLPV